MGRGCRRACCPLRRFPLPACTETLRRVPPAGSSLAAPGKCPLLHAPLRDHRRRGELGLRSNRGRDQVVLEPISVGHPGLCVKVLLTGSRNRIHEPLEQSPSRHYPLGTCLTAFPRRLSPRLSHPSPLKDPQEGPRDLRGHSTKGPSTKGPEAHGAFATTCPEKLNSSSHRPLSHR